jgi:hypothetical protein
VNDDDMVDQGASTWLVLGLIIFLNREFHKLIRDVSCQKLLNSVILSSA